MATVSDDQHELPTCDVIGCDRRAPARRSRQRLSDARLDQILPGDRQHAADSVYLCVSHFREFVARA